MAGLYTFSTDIESPFLNFESSLSSLSVIKTKNFQNQRYIKPNYHLKTLFAIVSFISNAFMQIEDEVLAPCANSFHADLYARQCSQSQKIGQRDPQSNFKLPTLSQVRKKKLVTKALASRDLSQIYIGVYIVKFCSVHCCFSTKKRVNNIALKYAKLGILNYTVRK